MPAEIVEVPVYEFFREALCISAGAFMTSMTDTRAVGAASYLVTAPRGTRLASRCSERSSSSGGITVSKRELIEPHDGDKRYVRRDDEGKFTEDQVDVGRSLSQDRRRHAEHAAPKGQGDRKSD